MKQVNEITSKPVRPVKVLQFGEGNFLRAFVDLMIDIANEKRVFDGSVMIAKPIPHGSLRDFAAQDCVYTALLRGMENGKTVSSARIVTSVAGAVDCNEQYDDYAAQAKNPDLRFVVSNTTEAGIVRDESDELALTPPKSYPGKLTKLLYERWLAFEGDPLKGLIILPVELIENNGRKLRECCEWLSARWGLPAAFVEWMRGCNVFCQTLVDRIVTGYPKDEAAALESQLGYQDKLMAAGEPFALWVIESDKPELVRGEFPLDKAGLPVVFTDDLRPYRERKVRLLNGAHTATVLAAYLAGLDTVGELMADKSLRALMERNVYDELAPCVPLPEAEVRAFADSVMERFENPFIRHSLLSISLNSVSKFKARVLPSIKDNLARTGRPPESLSFSLAALMAFYAGDAQNGKLIGKRGEDLYEILDDDAVLKFFAESGGAPAAEFVDAFLGRTDFWDEDLRALPGLSESVRGHLTEIREKGMRQAVISLLHGRQE